MSARRRTWYDQNREKVSARKRTYYQQNRDLFAARSRTRYEQNREQIACQQRGYREQHREQMAAASRVYRKQNPQQARTEAARQRGCTDIRRITAREIARMLALPCSDCGTRDRPRDLDHIIPISRGGRHSIGNAQPLCRRCNQRKGQRLPIEHRAGRRAKAA